MKVCKFKYSISNLFYIFGPCKIVTSLEFLSLNIGGATREEQIIQKEQILAELQRVEKELKEKGPSAAPNTTPPAPGVSNSNIGQQYSTSCHKGGITGGNTSISLNIPAATEILQNMANLTLQDQHHRGTNLLKNCKIKKLQVIQFSYMVAQSFNFRRRASSVFLNCDIFHSDCAS